jgi:pimeloyl-ACP methyl ester carboxylesterase
MSTDDDRETELYRQRADTVAVERGEGPAVVFAHGTLMDRTMFEPQLEALSDDYRCIAYNLRARTDRCADDYDLWDLADDLDALLDALDVDSCVLAGMSMGGFTALRFAHRYPDRVDGLVLVDSQATAHSESNQEQYGQMIEQTRAAGEVPEGLADIVKNLLFGRTTLEENPELVQHWVDRWFTYPGEAVYRETSSWLHRPDFTDEASAIDVPTLVTHGEEDISIEMDEAEATVEAMPNARLVPIPEAGHSSNLENPEASNAAIREFLEEVY